MENFFTLAAISTENSFNKSFLKKPQEYFVIGLMSGTSLDGVDLACCRFIFGTKSAKKEKWEFEILKAETVPYNKEWKGRLLNLPGTDAETFVKTHVELGNYFGTLIKKFISKHHLKAGLVSSHGHTVFHQPEKGFTCQIGDGAQIAAITSMETVCDFRTKDVALGGQGAPLVPVGDHFLFDEYDLCLNLGGIANISFKKNNKPIAFDICPVNIMLNRLASEVKLNFDKNGQLAAKGRINKSLLKRLNELVYYRKLPPKSIGKEWFMKNIDPLISDATIPLNDRLRTCCEHIALQIANSVPAENKTTRRMLITGGGAHNKFLIQCIENSLQNKQQYKKVKVVIPPKEIIDFKEALLFAFLGVLRVRNEINIFCSVTGARKNSIGGTLYAAG